MKIAIGSDHRGFELKRNLIIYLRKKGHQVEDYGPASTQSCDYPKFALAVARAIEKGKAKRGVLICYTGLGMTMAANKIKSVRAANCSTITSARFSREHNNANVLVLPGGFVKQKQAKRIIDVWLKTEFSAGRHLRRIKMFSK